MSRHSCSGAKSTSSSRAELPPLLLMGAGGGLLCCEHPAMGRAVLGLSQGWKAVLGLLFFFFFFGKMQSCRGGSRGADGGKSNKALGTACPAWGKLGQTLLIRGTPAFSWRCAPSQPAQRCAQYPRCGTRFKPFTARFVLLMVALRPSCCARGCDRAWLGAAAAQHLYRNPVFVGSAAASCSLLLAWAKHGRGFSPVASCGGTFIFFFLFLFF